MGAAIRFEPMPEGGEREVYALVAREFEAFVQADCTDEGVEMFFEAVRFVVCDKPENYFVLVARETDVPVGMIAVGDNNHISLFFVKKSHQGRGIGRLLFENALERCLKVNPELQTVDVHSSLYAVPIYETLGFRSNSGVEIRNGIRYVEMLYRVR